VGAPEIGYVVGETLAAPFLFVGNILATGAAGCSSYSDLLTGDTRLNLSVKSDTNGLTINGGLAFGTSSTDGGLTTALGWIPGVPSYGSLTLQSIAVANDFGVGQKTGLLDGKSYRTEIYYSSNPTYKQYLPEVQKE
jgi:hypothetical protein